MAPVFKNVGEKSTAKNQQPVSLLSVVSKVFEKLVNNISKAFDRVWHAGLLPKLKSYGSLVKYLALFLLFPYSFPMMLSVILLSMLILLSTLNVIRHVICSNNYN